MLQNISGKGKKTLWGTIAGDGNADGQVGNEDKLDVWCGQWMPANQVILMWILTWTGIVIHRIKWTFLVRMQEVVRRYRNNFLNKKNRRNSKNTIYSDYYPDEGTSQRSISFRSG